MADCVLGKTLEWIDQGRSRLTLGKWLKGKCRIEWHVSRGAWKDTINASEPWLALVFIKFLMAMILAYLN